MSDADHSPSRPSRRALIRGAAAAGALTWTAPAIIDSLTSPAAAASVEPGCYRAEFTLDAESPGCGTYTRNSPPAEGTGCPAGPWNNLPDYANTITLTVDSPPLSESCVYTVALGPSSGCTIDNRSAARQDQGDNCVSGALATGCEQVTFTNLTFVPDRFKILISCGGTLCAGGASCG